MRTRKRVDETLILNLHKPQTFVVFDRHNRLNAIKSDEQQLVA